MRIRTALAFLLALFFCAPALAQSTATPVLDGYLSTSGCQPGFTSCWKAYGQTSGSLNVNITGGGSGSNAAAGPTGSAVPADAGYTGLNNGGNLIGWVGNSSGWGIVSLGDLTTTSPCAAYNTASCTYLQVLQLIAQQAGAALPAGTNVVGYTSNDPCAQAAKLTASFEATSSGGNLISGSSGKQTYICAISLITSAAANISLCEATSTACSGGTPAAVYLNTGTTAANGAAFAANGGIQAGTGGYTIARTATAGQNVDVLFTTTNSPQVNLTVSYVQQ